MRRRSATDKEKAEEKEKRMKEKKENHVAGRLAD
jgi:hypothetical protein